MNDANVKSCADCQDCFEMGFKMQPDGSVAIKTSSGNGIAGKANALCRGCVVVRVVAKESVSQIATFLQVEEAEVEEFIRQTPVRWFADVRAQAEAAQGKEPFTTEARHGLREQLSQALRLVQALPPTPDPRPIVTPADSTLEVVRGQIQQVRERLQYCVDLLADDAKAKPSWGTDGRVWDASPRRRTQA